MLEEDGTEVEEDDYFQVPIFCSRKIYLHTMLADLGEQHHSDAAVCWGKVLHSSINPGKDVFFSTWVLNVKVCIFASPEIKVKSYNC